MGFRENCLMEGIAMDEDFYRKLSEYRLLYAEDDRGVQTYMHELLNLFFNETLVANDGKEAYALYKEYHPDLIITDIKMPHMSGIELIRKIREHDLDTKAIIVTAYSEVELLLEVMDLSLVCYIVKPITESKLLEALEKFLHVREKKLYKELASECYYDSVQKSILYRDCICELSKRESKFIELLIMHHDSLVSYELIEEKLWPDEYMSLNAMRLMIKNLRKKLPDGVIKNVQGLGYKL